MTDFHLGIVALCDAAYRDDLTGKSVLAGVYSGPVVVTQFPASFRAVFYIELFLPDKLGHRLEIRSLVNGEVQGVATFKARAADPDLPTVLLTPPRDLTLEAPGEIQLTLSVDDDPPRALIVKQIRADSAGP